VEQLVDLGITVDERQETPDGDYAWFDDPEGNRIELWQEKEE
jgi:predicted enzyme related to lactoylglutathione lyase